MPLSRNRIQRNTRRRPTQSKQTKQVRVRKTRGYKQRVITRCRKHCKSSRQKCIRTRGGRNDSDSLPRAQKFLTRYLNPGQDTEVRAVILNILQSDPGYVNISENDIDVYVRRQTPEYLRTLLPKIIFCGDIRNEVQRVAGIDRDIMKSSRINVWSTIRNSCPPIRLQTQQIIISCGYLL